MRRARLVPREVALLLLDAFSEMVFVHGRVHADPHPGNLLVRPLTETKQSELHFRPRSGGRDELHVNGTRMFAARAIHGQGGRVPRLCPLMALHLQMNKYPQAAAVSTRANAMTSTKYRTWQPPFH